MIQFDFRDEVVVHDICNRQLGVNEKNVIHLLKMSDAFDLNDLSGVCYRYISEKMTDELKSDWAKYLAETPAQEQLQLIQSINFLHFSFDMVVQCLENRIFDGKVKLEAILFWISGDVENRKKQLPLFLKDSEMAKVAQASAPTLVSEKKVLSRSVSMLMDILPIIPQKHVAVTPSPASAMEISPHPIESKPQPTRSGKRRKPGEDGHLRGISFSRTTNKWLAKLTYNKARHYIGKFNTQREAAEARDKAIEEVKLYGYHLKRHHPNKGIVPHPKPINGPKNDQNNRDVHDGDSDNDFTNDDLNVRGILYDPQCKRFVAKIYYDSKRHYLGRFVTREAAARAVFRARKEVNKYGAHIKRNYNNRGAKKVAAEKAKPSKAIIRKPSTLVKPQKPVKAVVPPPNPANLSEILIPSAVPLQMLNAPSSGSGNTDFLLTFIV